jgi:hypothetical protein
MVRCGVRECNLPTGRHTASAGGRGKIGTAGRGLVRIHGVGRHTIMAGGLMSLATAGAGTRGRSEPGITGHPR